MSTDTPSPASPAPTDRGDRMSTPTPLPSVKVDREANALYVTLDAARMVASTVEANSQVNVDYDSGGAMVGIEILDLDFPAASAPQGDTTPEDVIEQARGIAYRALADAPRTRPDGKRFGSIAGDRVCADAVIDAFAAAGLLAVAASPAVPQARERGELWNVLDWSLWGNGMADTFRDPLADKMIAALTDAEYEQATALIERWKRLRGDQAYRKLYEDQRAEIERLKALSAPAPADDKAAQVERMAAAIAKDDGFDWRSGEWNDVYLSRARAALAALKEGEKA